MLVWLVAPLSLSQARHRSRFDWLARSAVQGCARPQGAPIVTARSSLLERLGFFSEDEQALDLSRERMTLIIGSRSKRRGELARLGVPELGNARFFSA